MIFEAYPLQLDAYSLSVGDRLGEGLVVKESCVNPNKDESTCEKTKYVTALPGRSGQIEFPVTVSGNFDVSMNIDQNQSDGGGTWGETITLFGSNTSLSMTYRIHIGGNGVVICSSNNPQDTPTGSENSTWVSEWGWIGGFTSNDSRINVQNGLATCYINGTPYSYPGKEPTVVTLADSNRTYDRVAVSGINDRDRLYEIKVRGLQTACTDTSGTNNSSPATLSSNLSLHIPKLMYRPISGSPMDLWADLQFVPGADGSLMWRLSNYGLNQ